MLDSEPKPRQISVGASEGSGLIVVVLISTYAFGSRSVFLGLEFNLACITTRAHISLTGNFDHWRYSGLLFKTYIILR